MEDNDQIEVEESEVLAEEEDTEEVTNGVEDYLPAPIETSVVSPKMNETIELEDAKCPVEFTTSIRFNWLGTNYSFRRGDKAKVSKELKSVLVSRDAVKAL